ncbi:MAG: hypothetical protein OXI24_03330 [Candidatus Poribacteria bacterium]|nr:hypothetical protein [Candidatus Poribacteria bacterium]
MILDLNIDSERFDELTDKIISKYQTLNKPEFNDEISEFAENLKYMYERFYPVFLKTQHQHGIYLALVNVTPGNITDFHEERRTENHEIFWQEDPVVSLYLSSSVFESLLMNLRKLSTDISVDRSVTSNEPPRAISMKRIVKDIKDFHKKIGATTSEFVEFEENIESLASGAKNEQELEKLWRYTDKYNIHLEDQYLPEEEQLFVLETLRFLINDIMAFMGAIDKFYNHREPADIIDTMRSQMQGWIAAFAAYKSNSIRSMKEYVEALARLCIHSNYIGLEHKEASEKIVEEMMLEGNENFEFLKTIMKIEIEKRIPELRDEFIKNNNRIGNSRW